MEKKPSQTEDADSDDGHNAGVNDWVLDDELDESGVHKDPEHKWKRTQWWRFYNQSLQHRRKVAQELAWSMDN